MISFQRRKIWKSLCASFLFWAICMKAHADAALLLEVPLAALHPFIAGGLAVEYLGDGRFHPDSKAQIFDPAHALEPGESAESEQSASTEGSNNAVSETSSSGAAMQVAHEP
jgi:hypothetical protein